ncbi:MAG: EAL domain-containing protein, partial [Pseudomonadota bacterium]
LADIVRAKKLGDEIRIWVPGCATGEEAYSIAILLAEQMNEQGKECRVQIFATDIDAEAMAVARRGVYALGSMQEMDSELLREYFIPLENGAHYEIARRVRDMVVFARQDLTRDPPFLRLDLISCRNVLIYFSQELQTRVLNIFHYALSPHGYLFLGRSEGVHQQEENFEILGKEAKLFRRLTGSGSRPPMFTAPAVLHNLDMEKPRKVADSGGDEFAAIAEEVFVPPAVLVDGQMEVVHVYGEVTPFLSITSGSPRFELLHLLRPEFRGEVQPLIFVAERKGKVVYSKQQKLKGLGSYRLAIHPVKDSGKRQLFMVAFEQVKRQRSSKRGEVTTEVRELEEQLIATRENLQTVIQELETSNEEMQALNEELQASNEELQSSNEELEASNEELQSTNEELTTVNEEMRVKSQELQQLNSELQNVENSISHPLLIADRHMNILRFNRAAALAFQLTAESRGCQLTELSLPTGLEELAELAVKAMARGETIERNRIQGGERTYMASVSPAWDKPGKIRGTILTLTDTTEAASAEDKVRESEALLMSIMNNSPSLVALKDLAGRYTFVNEQYARYFNLDVQAIIGSTDSEMLPASVAAQFRERDLEAIHHSRALTHDEHLVIDGEQRHLATTRIPLLDTHGRVNSVSTQAIDITARVRAEEQLRLAARVFEHSGEGIIVTDKNSVIVTVNDAFTRITGYLPEEAIGKTPSLLRSGKHDESFYEHMWWQLQDKGWWQGEIWNRRKDGSNYMEWLTINGVRDQDGNLLHFIGVFSDIDAVREGKDRLSYLATHDELTGLANRSLFQDRLQQLIAQASRSGNPFSVIFIDLDHFKLINDSAGHAAGDQLLKSAASRLSEVVRDEDTVSRLGGDEFGILLRTADKEVDIERTARRILHTLAEPFEITGRTVHIGASIGIAIFPNDGETVESLLKAADTAMYEAKGEGRDTFRFFSSDLREQVEKRMSLKTELRRALDQNELALHFQPRFCLSTGEIVSIESLLRWEHPEEGIILPGEFIDILEETGLIVPVGQWVMKESMKQARAWHNAGLTQAPVSVNVSARQFRGADFNALLEHCQDASGLLEIELTERVIMADPESATERMNGLRELGINIAMDDFGTGYSSLLYLKEFPINVIKLDRGFIANLPGSERDAAIAHAVVSMAHALDLTVVAEGIETIEQADFIKQIGCHELQGFLVCRPRTAAEIAAMLARGTRIPLESGWTLT